MAGLIRRKPRVVPVPATAPVDPDLQQIDEWEAWFRSGHEELLREWPNTSDADKQQIAQRRDASRPARDRDHSGTARRVSRTESHTMKDHVVYDSVLFRLAHKRFMCDAKALTDEDIQQLALVNPQLEDRARAKRAGFLPAPEADAETVGKKAISLNFFRQWMDDFLGPIFAAHAYRQKELKTEFETQIRSLQGRVLELEAERASRMATLHDD